MNEQELMKKVRASIDSQCYTRGFAAPVDVLMDVGALTKQQYTLWRQGRVDYLERVCTMNLHRLAAIMHEIRSTAVKKGLKPSVTVYGPWKSKHSGNSESRLRFSKSGNPDIEKYYATHYVDSKRIAELKQKKEESTTIDQQA